MAKPVVVAGDPVKVLNGPDKGKEGVVASCDLAAHSCKVRLKDETEDKTFDSANLEKQ